MDESTYYVEPYDYSDSALQALAALKSFKSDLPAPLEHYGAAMICGDVHVPLTKYEMVEAMYEKAAENELDTLILAGDLFNFDSLGRFDPKQSDHTLAQELQIGREFVSALINSFKRVYIIKGNHEDRFMRALGYKLDFVQTMQLVLGDLYTDNIDRLEISNLDHMYLYGPEDQKYYVNHPKAYSRQPLATGRALAAKHGCNIICGHAHHHAVGSDISGKFVVAELGGLFDIDKTAYLREATTFPKQQNGLIWVDEDGRLHSWSPLWQTQS